MRQHCTRSTNAQNMKQGLLVTYTTSAWMPCSYHSLCYALICYCVGFCIASHTVADMYTIHTFDLPFMFPPTAQHGLFGRRNDSNNKTHTFVYHHHSCDFKQNSFIEQFGCNENNVNWWRHSYCSLIEKWRKKMTAATTIKNETLSL